MRFFGFTEVYGVIVGAVMEGTAELVDAVVGIVVVTTMEGAELDG